MQPNEEGAGVKFDSFKDEVGVVCTEASMADLIGKFSETLDDFYFTNAIRVWRELKRRGFAGKVTPVRAREYLENSFSHFPSWKLTHDAERGGEKCDAAHAVLDKTQEAEDDLNSDPFSVDKQENFIKVMNNARDGLNLACLA